jgi:hypothetical protein
MLKHRLYSIPPDSVENIRAAFSNVLDNRDILAVLGYRNVIVARRELCGHNILTWDLETPLEPNNGAGIRLLAIAEASSKITTSIWEQVKDFLKKNRPIWLNDEKFGELGIFHYHYPDLLIPWLAVNDLAEDVKDIVTAFVLVGGLNCRPVGIPTNKVIEKLLVYRLEKGPRGRNIGLIQSKSVSFQCNTNSEASHAVQEANCRLSKYNSQHGPEVFTFSVTVDDTIWGPGDPNKPIKTVVLKEQSKVCGIRRESKPSRFPFRFDGFRYVIRAPADQWALWLECLGLSILDAGGRQ